MRIPASRLKAYETLFEDIKGIRYTVIVFADNKEGAIKIARKCKLNFGYNLRKDKLIFIGRSYKDKLGGYYKGKMVDIVDI